MDKDTQKELQETIIPNKFCIHCVHKKRFSRSYKHQVYCEMQPSGHSLSGFRTIKAHDCACGLYEQKL